MNEFGAPVIDSHCHLDFKQFNKDREAVINRARDSGVMLMINSGIDHDTNIKSLKMAEENEFIYPTLGLNPNSLGSLTDEELNATLSQMMENAGIAVGIGEAGLDHYRCSDQASRTKQAEVFRKVIEVARSLDLPLVIHSRDAEQQALEMVKDLDKVVFHCYGGTLGTMKEAVDHGFYISIATVICYSPHHQILARNVPLDKLLIETDSPFLSPRKGRNEPSFVLDSVRLIAKIRGMQPSEIARITSENTMKVFGIR